MYFPFLKKFSVLVVATTCLFCATATAQTERSDVAEIQTHLTYLGFNPAGIDGQIGGGTKSALRQFQLQNGLPVTGLPNKRTQRVLRQVVNSKLATQYGRQLKGEFGTVASCRISSARLVIDGLRVIHKPTWAETGFDYVLYPTGGDRFKVQWDVSGRQTGLAVQFDTNRDAFRVPEMQMLALTRCTSNEENNTDGGSASYVSVPKVPETPLGLVQEEIDELGKKLQEANQLRGRIAAKLDQRSGRFGSLQAQVRSLEANLKAAQTEGDGLRANLRRAQNQIKDLRQRHADLTAERDNLLSENNQLISQRANTSDQRGARLRTANAALRQENERLRALLQQMGASQQQENGALRFQTKDGRFQFSLGGR